MDSLFYQMNTFKPSNDKSRCIMKISIPHLLSCKSFLYFWLLVMLLVSCTQKSGKQTEVINEDKIKTDSLAQQPVVDTPVTTPTPSANPSEQVKRETGIVQPMKPKICDINLTLVATPKKGQLIYYVTGLVPGEFKCWVDLENSSQKICNGNACVIYFVDVPNPTINKNPPHFMDAATLLKNGVGLYENTSKNWVMRGANIWGRKDKGFGYYNTNNAGGG